MADLALMIFPEAVCCFRQVGEGWRLCRLEGEESAPIGETPAQVARMLVRELHDSATLAQSSLHLLFASASSSRNWMRAMMEQAYQAGFRCVQALGLEPLLARAGHESGLPAAMPFEASWNGPVIERLLDAALIVPFASAIESVPGDEQLAALARRCAELEAENAGQREGYEALQAALASAQAQIAQFGQPRAEELVRFMPLFYRRFWEQLSPDQFAQLLGLREAPVIASPFTEPDAAVLAIMKRQFLALPAQVRETVLRMVRDCQVDLDVRPEMRKLLKEVE